MSAAAELALSEVAKIIFAHLLQAGDGTRRVLAESAKLSFPTVTMALAELTSRGMVCELRREQGAKGRATIVYGVSDDAGWILGVDIGATQISFMARSLNGRLLAHGSRKHTGPPTEMGILAGSLVAKSRPLKAIKTAPLVVALALNQVVPRKFVDKSNPRPLALEIAEMFVTSSNLSRSVPFLLENNVNCAAVAEHQDGLMRGYDDAAYMQIGVGIGLGFFADGALIKGGQGGSGELAQIPLSWNSDIPSPMDAIEHRYGSAGLVDEAARISAHDDNAPTSPEALFALAADGDLAANALVQQHGVALGRIASTIAAVLDPTILVLGGGLVKSSQFASIIIDEFKRRNKGIQIAVSQKGSEATVLGACLLALDQATKQIVDKFHKPILTRPTFL